MKKMKFEAPVIVLCLVLICYFFCKHDVKAASVYDSGYTEDNIHYVIYDMTPVKPLNSIQSDSIPCTMDLVYDAIATPPSTLSVTKIISGIRYSGVLRLVSTHIENGKLTATYSGLLFAEN